LKEKRPDEITSRDITAETDSDARLVTYYFGSKAKLMEAAAQATFAEFRSRATLSDDAGPLPERLRRHMRIFRDFAKENPHMRQLLADHLWDASDPHVARAGRDALAVSVSEFADLIAEGRESGEMWEMDPRFLVIAMIALGEFPFANTRLFEAVMGERVTDEVMEAYGEFMLRLILGGRGAGTSGADG